MKQFKNLKATMFKQFSLDDGKVKKIIVQTKYVEVLVAKPNELFILI